MIVTLDDTNSSAIARELIRMREEGGAIALGRVLTLIVVATSDVNEDAIEAANEASGEHPMRVIVVHTYPDGDGAKLDAEIRVGSDAGASEVVVLHASGPASEEPASLIQPLLLPDTPVVTWWPDCSETHPAQNPLGELAQLRIVDSFKVAEPFATLAQLAEGYESGDTNLAWARITRWRAQLASVLDQPPYDPITGAEVSYRKLTTSTLLMAGWLAHYLKVPVTLQFSDDDLAGNLRAVKLFRHDGVIELRRTAKDTAILSQPDQPDQIVPLAIRNRFSVLSEELRSFAADPIYAAVLLEGVPEIAASNRELTEQER
ncbi:glucose-6-phosphate dehydrogenase assembly protein OpcA [Gulosibacter massiliensis]|uniref:glucose-6-phosphate dehydrogenase assembly protein OpcA n=1 Tax=Gulosibacter massiliensis TaxID=2479839 RepID=UPI000F632519|nr:glucose-6-phosphate dehydrogenase assembly protein OpcA [Gulosibacter massiliensis]